MPNERKTVFGRIKGYVTGTTTEEETALEELRRIGEEVYGESPAPGIDKILNEVYGKTPQKEESIALEQLWQEISEVCKER